MKFARLASDAVVGGDDEGLAFGGELSSPAQEFDADGAIDFASGEKAGRHYDIGAIRDSTEDVILNSLCFHRYRRSLIESERLAAPQRQQGRRSLMLTWMAREMIPLPKEIALRRNRRPQAAGFERVGSGSLPPHRGPGAAGIIEIQVRRVEWEMLWQSPRAATQSDNAVKARRLRTSAGIVRAPLAQALPLLTLGNLCRGGS